MRKGLARVGAAQKVVHAPAGEQSRCLLGSGRTVFYNTELLRGKHYQQNPTLSPAENSFLPASHTLRPADNSFLSAIRTWDLLIIRSSQQDLK